MQTRTYAGILLLALGVSSAVVLADTRIEFKVTEGGGTFANSILIGHGKVRFDADQNTSVLIDPTDSSMTMIDHGKKTFTRIGKAELAQMADMMKQMEQQIANMPPEMRQMMQGRMGGAGGPQSVTVDTGEKGTVAGKSCRIFRTTMSGRTTSEQCRAEPTAIDIPAADRATMASAMAWAKELSDSLKGPMSRYGDASPFGGGLVPLRTTTFGSDGARSTSEFVAATAGTLAENLFAVPAGYKEQKVAMPGRGRGGF